jgi:RimJ/RimL family protein N-acetyltransferase
MEIETGRLRLRRLDAGDVEAMTALFVDREVRRHLAVNAMDAFEARNFAVHFIRESRAEFQSSGSGAMAVVPRAAPTAAGYCGLRPIPGEAGTFELMYALAPRFWGLGLATEAARACLDWGFRNLSIESVIGMARPENLASCKVMRKLGMAYSGVTHRYYDDRLALYRLPRFAWSGARQAAL